MLEFFLTLQVGSSFSSPGGGVPGQCPIYNAGQGKMRPVTEETERKAQAGTGHKLSGQLED